MAERTGGRYLLTHHHDGQRAAQLAAGALWACAREQLPFSALRRGGRVRIDDKFIDQRAKCQDFAREVKFPGTAHLAPVSYHLLLPDPTLYVVTSQ